MKLAIVGASGGTAVGQSLRRAAERLGMACQLIDTDAAFGTNRWLRAMAWHLADRRPVYLRRFGEKVIAHCREAKVDTVIATGAAPLSASVVRQLTALGIRTVNYSTDDPWNSRVCGQWLRDALPEYSLVATPRSANLGQLKALGARAIHVSFGYDDELFYRTSAAPDWRYDLAFVGGADPDRMALVQPLLASGLKVALFGGFWDRYPAAAAFARGMLDPVGLRSLAGWARLSLCVVRRRNRDGHVMRTFESAACGECLLVERTAEHEQIFGEDGDCVRYFRDPEQLPALAQALLNDPDRCALMRDRVTERVTSGHHRYLDRLQYILAALDQTQRDSHQVKAGK